MMRRVAPDEWRFIIRLPRPLNIGKMDEMSAPPSAPEPDLEARIITGYKARYYTGSSLPHLLLPGGAQLSIAELKVILLRMEELRY